MKKKQVKSASRRNIEYELLIAAAQLEPDEQALLKIKKLSESDLDWASIFDQANRLRMLPLLFHSLVKSEILPQIPSHLVKAARTARHRTTIRNLYRYGKFKTLLEEFRRLNISPILLKGIYYARWIYNDIGLRPMSDIDLLIQENEAEEAAGILISQGYKQPPYRSRIHQLLLEKESHHLPIFRSPDGSCIELHVSLFTHNQNRERLNKKIQKTAVSLDFNGHQVQTMSPEFHLLFGLSHLERHLRVGTLNALYWVTDLQELIRLTPDMNWPEVGKEFSQLENHDQCSEILKWLVEFWDAPIPSEIMDRETSGRSKAAFYEVLDSGHPANKNRAEKKIYIGKMLSRLSVIREFAGSRGVLIFLWRQLFPAKNALFYRYQDKAGWKSGFLYCYHIFEGIRMVAAGLFLNHLRLRAKSPDEINRKNR